MLIFIRTTIFRDIRLNKFCREPHRLFMTKILSKSLEPFLIEIINYVCWECFGQKRSTFKIVQNIFSYVYIGVVDILYTYVPNLMEIDRVVSLQRCLHTTYRQTFCKQCVFEPRRPQNGYFQRNISSSIFLRLLYFIYSTV